jgi:hypothetical protein
VCVGCVVGQGKSVALMSQGVATRRALAIAMRLQLESAALVMCWEECSDAVHALKGGAGEVLQSLSLQGGTPGFGVSGSQY